MSKEDIADMVEKHGTGHGGLISILEEIQSKYGYLPERALRDLAEKTGSSLVDIYGVATFYRAFSLSPRGKHLISVCLGTACHVRGAPRVLQEFERQLGIPAGTTTTDREFTLDTVNCFSTVSTPKVKGILDRTVEGLDKIEIETDKRIFPVEVSCARCNHSLMDPQHPIDGHTSIRVTVSFGQKHGWLVLSSLYGSYNVASEHEIPLDTIVHVFCPHCHAELMGGAKCGECGASMVPMIVRGGGIVQICSRRGCKGHLLDVG
jgi:NADH:ubiquinone oxidoreductase subunit E